MPLKFGTSGVRGLVTELTDSEVFLFTTAFLTHAHSLGQTDSPIMIAYDLRESSPRIEKAVINAVQAFGRIPIKCGTLPTPALAFYAQQQKSLAIMITGSHIPADRNGIKFYLESGETLKADDEAIFKIYEALKTQNPPLPTPKEFPVKDSSREALRLYQERYSQFFPGSPLKGFKFLFYQHSSVARDVFPEILRNLGAEVLCLGRSETFIPVDTEAVEAVDTFRAWIREHQADALISTDGDADRPLLVDKMGRIIPGDKVGALASLYLGCEAIALPISCNSGIGELPAFRKVIATKIGSPFVVAALNQLAQEYTRVAGFEANGGYLLQSKITREGRELEKLPTRDAVLPVLCVMALAQQKNLHPAELGQLLPPRFTASGLLKNFPTEKSLSIIKKASAEASSFFARMLPSWNLSLKEINTLDGLRCRFDGDLIVHLRPSGNAPEFRCYTEAPEQETADRLCAETLRALG